MTNVILAGEDGADAERRRQAYLSELGARGRAETDQITLACAHVCRGLRCLRANASAEEGRADDASDKQAVDRQLETLRLIGLLDTEPAVAVVQLSQISNGLVWLLEQAKALDHQINYHGYLHPSQRRFAQTIFGRKPDEMFLDQLAMTWTLDVIAASQDDPSTVTAGQLACILQSDKPRDLPAGEFERRLADYLHWVTSTTSADARDRLREVLAQYRQKLLGQLEVVKQREARQAARATAEAGVSASKECMLRLRYLRESDRGAQGALRELRRLQEWRLSHGDELGMETPPGSAVATAPENGVETTAEGAPAGPQEAVSRTEAAAPDNAGGSSSCDAVCGQYTAAPEGGAGPIARKTPLAASEAHPEAVEKPPPR